jgi:hypothetical protein
VSSDYEPRYDYTITINGVLQEVMRAKFDNDQMTSLIIHRLAWHTERWMKAAIESGANERVLILAAHALTLEGHASRLNVKSDYVAYLRGNLASILHRQHKNDQAAQLLRSEIDHYRGRTDERAQQLTCQASIQLAGILSEDTPCPVDDIVNLLGDAYFFLANSATDQPEDIATLIMPIRSTLRNMELGGIRDERLAMLRTAIDELIGRLPVTPFSSVMRTLNEAAACLMDMNTSQAAELCRNLLDHEYLSEHTLQSLHIRCEVRRLLIESLVHLGDIDDALAELDHFTEDARPLSMFVRETESLVHNTGLHCAPWSFDGFPRVDELLSRLLSDGRAELIERSYPGEKAARIRLLRGIDAFNHGDLVRGQRFADEFIKHCTSYGDLSGQQQGWLGIVNLFIDVLAVERGKVTGIIEPLMRVHDRRGLGRLMRLAASVQDMLNHCNVELLPLYTALALVHDELAGPPGKICIPVCHQLLGGLKYLGFDGEVIAASAIVMNIETKDTEDVGEYKRAPRLEDDGSTDGHVVVWLESFRRLVDPTIAQSRTIQTAARLNAGLGLPVVVPVPNREILLSPESPGPTTIRAPLLIGWILQPQWTELLTPVQGSDLHAGIAYGQLSLAYAILDVVRGLEHTRSDLQRLRDLYKPIAALLDDHAHLPRLPDEPPTSFFRLRRGVQALGLIPVLLRGVV